VCWIESIDVCWIEPNSVLLFHLLISHVFLLLSVLFNVSYTGCMLSKFIYERQKNIHFQGWESDQVGSGGIGIAEQGASEHLFF
jgi:hypothetical protein